MKIYFFLLISIVCFSYNTSAQGYIEFTENKGQWDNNIIYNGKMGFGQFALTKTGYKVLMYDEKQLKAIEEKYHYHIDDEEAANAKLNGQVWNVNFINCNKDFKIVPTKKVPGINNYFIGNDKSKWGTECYSYTNVKYENIYNNIDIQFYTNNGVLKYDFIVKPGGNVNDIKLQYDGIDKIKKGKKGEVVLETSIGQFNESSPYVYQVDESQRKVINSGYEIKGNMLSFKLADFDPKSTLIIDPTLVFSTHSGSNSDNWGFTATYGPDETLYGGGDVRGTGFPVSAGAFQTSWGGGTTDIGIIKFSANGTTKMYATYIGGSSDEQPHSLICDPQGNLIVAGRSNSANYPFLNTFGTRGGYDIVITKLNATGTAILGSLIIGGSGNDGVNVSTTRSRSSLQYNYGDDGRSEVNLDAAGNILLASCTQSNNFYVTPNALQNSLAGSQDAVLLKASPTLNSIIFSTYFGGTSNDAAYVVNANSADGNLYFAGGTESNNLPGNTTGVIQPNNAGGADGFITVINPLGTAIVKTTYIGTSGHDQIYGIQFDKFNFPYIMGISLGNFPVINSAYSNPGSHQFIAKLQKDLSAIVYSTVFGTNSPQTNISPVAFLVDKCENVYVSGWGGTVISSFSNSGTFNLPIVNPLVNGNITDGKDFYYFVLEKNGASQFFGSFFGGFQNANEIGEHVDGGTSRFDPKGAIYQAACASCGIDNSTPAEQYPSFPNSKGAGFCNLGLTKIKFNFTGVGADLHADDTSGCVPLTVNFTDEFKNAVSYEYNFADGTGTFPTTNSGIQHTFPNIGVYKVRLIAIDLTSCNLRDTSYKTIRVRNDRATIGFNAAKQPPCLNLSYLLTNTSTPPAGKPFSTNSFTWDFGDGSGITNAGLTNQNKTYNSAGNYIIKLILKDTNYCNAPDTLFQEVRLSTTVKADFTSSNGCAPYTFAFKNTSLGGTSFQWNFGDGGTSTAIEPTYTFNNAGTYTVTLIANDPNTCNFTDTLRKTITIHPTPVANFSFNPVLPIVNTPTQFTNLSTNADTYKWIFNDGDSSTLTNPLHQFNANGTFTTCLYASNVFNCVDTICLPVVALVEPAIDIPNAFTPNGDGINDYIIPRGFGIKTVAFRIFNRWGQLIFETDQRNTGWDGRYKGKLQPMDAYSYTLNVELSDGQKIKKSGNITLIR